MCIKILYAYAHFMNTDSKILTWMQHTHYLKYSIKILVIYKNIKKEKRR